MADDKKYYYLKVKEGFFDSDQMIVLEAMPDGHLYSNILLKLYLRSLKNEGKLMFNDRIPYNATILSQVVRHPVGVVEKAIAIFKEFGLIEIMDNGAIYMLDIQNYIGQSSTEADRKRIYRDKIEYERLLLDKCPDKRSDKPTPEKEIELDTEKDTEKKITKKEIEFFFESIWELYPSKKGKASISDAKKKVLYSIGFDTIKNCIDRYVKDKEEWRPYKDGSTFFNSGYVDYLDGNYFPEEPQNMKTKKSGNVLDDIIREGMQNESDRNSEDYEIDPIAVQKLLQGSRRG